MLASCLLSATLALLSPPGEDVLVVDVPRHEVRLPESLSVTLAGSVNFAVDEDGTSFVRLPDDARVMLHGEPVEGRIEVAAGDSILVLSSGGDLTISVSDPVTKRVADAFASAVKVGSGAGGLVRQVTPPLVLGVSTTPLGEALAAQLALSPEDALLVVQVPEGLPAAEAGLLPHDVIVALDGKRPVDQEVLRKVLSGKSVGDVVAITLLRAGETLELEVAPIRRASDAGVIGKLLESRGGADAFGIEAGAYAADLARMAGELSERAEMESAAEYVETAKNAYATAAAHRAELESRLAQLVREREGKETEQARADLERALVGVQREQAELERNLARNEALLADAENSFEDKVRGLTRSRGQLAELKSVLEGLQRWGGGGRDVEIVEDDDGQRALLLGNRALESSRGDGPTWAGLLAGGGGDAFGLAASARATAEAKAAVAAAAASMREQQAESVARQHELSERVEERLGGVEERLARIEAMLEKLLAAKAH